MDPPDSAPLPSSELARCHLLGPVALTVQGIMGILVVLSLVVKRQYERRKRPWRIWLWDVSKQLCGQAVIHGLNLLISDQMALVAHNNPCSLYFLNVLIDTTLGVIVLFVALHAFTWLFSVHLGYEGFITGQYGDPPKPSFWWKQLLPYTLAVITLKAVVLIPLIVPWTSKGLLRFAHGLLDFLPSALQVVFAMAVFPVVMNVFQFCVVDQIIKAGQGQEKADAEDVEMDYAPVPTTEAEALPEESASFTMQRHASPVMRRTNSGMGGGSPRSSGFLSDGGEFVSLYGGLQSPGRKPKGRRSEDSV